MTDTPTPYRAPVSVNFLLVFSVIAAFIGVASLTPATQGVGFIACGVLWGIYARIAQAGAIARHR